MTPERWRQVSRIYHDARAHEPHARDAFVRVACQGDESLRQDVESLLGQASGDGFLELEPPATRVGQRVGPYHLEELLGAGGMGEVYRARDTTLGRQVAIKVVPEAFAQDAERLARFEREARLTGARFPPRRRRRCAGCFGAAWRRTRGAACGTPETPGS